jgi:hypothetical protein
MLAGDVPELVGYARLMDDEGKFLPLGWPPIGGSINIGPAQSYLTVPAVTAIAASVTAGETPPIWRDLVDDAAYIAFESSWRNLRHAVLLAAVAAEVAIKWRLASIATPEQAPLLDLLLNDNRIALQVARLYQDGAKAVSGRSLNEDDPTLYQGVEALFKARNRIAHHAKPAGEDEAMRQRVKDARCAIEWAEALRAEERPHASG